MARGNGRTSLYHFSRLYTALSPSSEEQLTRGPGAHNRTETFRKQLRLGSIDSRRVCPGYRAGQLRGGFVGNVPSLITFSSRNHGRVYTYRRPVPFLWPASNSLPGFEPIPASFPGRVPAIRKVAFPSAASIVVDSFWRDTWTLPVKLLPSWNAWNTLEWR